MSDNADDRSQAGFDGLDHQPAYIFTSSTDDTPTRPGKRRRIGRPRTSALEEQDHFDAASLEPLFNGLESHECVALRQEIFERSWSKTDERIQSILNEANEDTLAEVTTFINSSKQANTLDRVPSGFIVTGPNIASQELLFRQLSTHLKSEINGPVVILRSGDGTNLKAVLKKLIRDATNQRHTPEDGERLSFEQDGRKLLSYDLEILRSFVKANGSQSVVVAFQDSEAFDISLVSQLIFLFNSWEDRIPFVLLFGIATSVDLFNERLSNRASCCLGGNQFDVEHTSSLLERIFQRAVASSGAPLRLDPILVSSLMDRQEDHVQSVQSFTAALKFAYMCHFYGNALSILNDISQTAHLSIKLLQAEHFDAIRILPSFRNVIEKMIKQQQLSRVRVLLEDNSILLKEVEKSLASKNLVITRILRAMHLILSISPQTVNTIELYVAAFKNGLCKSDYLSPILDSIKRMTPEELLNFTEEIGKAIRSGSPEMDLPGWAGEESKFLGEVKEIGSQVSALVDDSFRTGKLVRSSYAIHNKGVRTTVIAQRVQLSYEKSTLSQQDKEYTAIVDHLSQMLTGYFALENPHDMFLHEVWLYDSISPYRNVFTPRPRAAVELALSAPYKYLNCDCCEPVEGLSSTHPATAILYQMYLETGSLINVFDLWSAFFEMVGKGDEQKHDERDALVLFYRALADLKLMGMVKQSKKKADHLAKIQWKGL